MPRIERVEDLLSQCDTRYILVTTTRAPRNSWIETWNKIHDRIREVQCLDNLEKLLDYAKHRERMYLYLIDKELGKVDVYSVYKGEIRHKKTLTLESTEDVEVTSSQYTKIILKLGEEATREEVEKLRTELKNMLKTTIINIEQKKDKIKIMLENTFLENSKLSQILGKIIDILGHKLKRVRIEKKQKETYIYKKKKNKKIKTQTQPT